MYNYFSYDEIECIVDYLDIKILGTILVELDEYLGEKILNHLENSKIYQLYKLLDKKSLYHFIHILSEDKKSHLISKLNKKDRVLFSRIDSYKENSVASIMDTTFMSINKSKKVRDILEKGHIIIKFSYLNYLFITNEESEFVGILSFKDLFLSSKDDEIEKIYKKQSYTVNIQTSISSLIFLVKKYNLDIVPVLSKNRKIMGQITSQYLIKRVEEENIEKVKQFAGITDDFDIRELSIIRHIFSRLPWLFISIIGGNLNAIIISLFKDVLKERIPIYFFLPTIMSISSIIGLQTILILVERYRFKHFNFKKFLLQEIQIVFLNSMFCGILFFSFTFVWNSLNISIFIMISVFIGGIISSFLGVLMFKIFKKMNIDVGIALGPFFTVLNDFSILLIYLLFANFFILLLII